MSIIFGISPSHFREKLYGWGSSLLTLLNNIYHNSSLLAICAQVLKEPYLSTLGIMFLMPSRIECLTAVLGLPLGFFV